MKKLNIIYMLLGCLLTFVACSDDDYFSNSLSIEGHRI